MNLLLTFTILTIINVVFSTIKSIATVKSSPLTASIISAVYYGYYNLVLVYTVADFSLYWKIFITFACNFIGVYVVKKFEDKMRKDRLWKVEATIPHRFIKDVHDIMDMRDIPHSYIDIEKYGIFNIYCATQKESAVVKHILSQYNAKYFVSESRGEL